MSGPEHYREAERLRGCARDYMDKRGSAAYFNAAAQVHATLALAAATIETAAARGPGDVSQVWIEAVR